MSRNRNYRREYQRRIERGLKQGKSRSAARGHARAADLPSWRMAAIDRNSPLEKALTCMRRGASQAAAAASAGVSVERLRRHRQLNTASQKEGKRWVIFDSRPQSFWMASEGGLISVTVPNDEGTTISHYWRAVDAFLYSNDDAHLFPFEGEGVFDVRNRFHRFEIRPNVLRRLDAVGELAFVEIYSDVR